MKKFIYLYFLALTTIISCQKPQDEILPEVTIEVKSVNQTEINLIVIAPSASEVELCKDLSQCVKRRVINGSAEFTFAQLASNTSYSFQATAFFSTGEKKSELIEVSTRALAVALKAAQVNLYSAILQGEIYNPENLEYHFEYGMQANNLEHKTNKSSGHGIVSTLVQNLNVRQNYFYRIVLTIDNQAFPSDVVSFKTLGDKPEIKDLQVIYADTLTMELVFLVKSNLLVSEVSLMCRYPIFSLGPITVNPDSNWTEVRFQIPVRTGASSLLVLQAENHLGITKVDTTVKSPAFMYDGVLYHWVQIGAQKWINSDFRGKHYLNGDPIPYIVEDTLWATATSGAMCYWGNEDQNYFDYGALYNFYVIEDERGITPPGWKVPEEEDYYELIRNVHYARLLREEGLDYWLEPNTATNETGFSARGGGKRGLWPNYGRFRMLKEACG